MTHRYPGPVRDQPLPVEFHNTVYADRGRLVDGIADGAGLRAWLAAVADRLPGSVRGADPARLADFVALRAAVRDALAAASAGRKVPRHAADALNAAAAADPQSLELRGSGVRVRHHGADATSAVLAALAAETIALVGGEDAAQLHTCGAPGCVLMFQRAGRRSAWCSPACGNRARQARHYARAHPTGASAHRREQG